MQKKLKIFRRFRRPSRHDLPQNADELKTMGRHPFAVPVITFAVLMLITAVGVFFVQRHAKPASHPYVVIVSHDNVKQTVPSREPTVGTLLDKLNITLEPGDVVEPALNAHINQDEFRINVYRAVPVQIAIGSHRTFAFSAARTPRSIAKQVGKTLYPADRVTAAPAENFIETGAIGQIVTVKPSVPVQLILYGAPALTRTPADTVGEMLKEKDIKLRPGDTVKPSTGTRITPNMRVFVLRKGTTIAVEKKFIPAPVRTVNDPTLTSGTSVVRQQGSPGIRLITFQVNKKTGAKKQLQSAIIQPPVAQIIARGTAPVPASSNLSTWLQKLRQCETGGNYQTNTGNGYYGAYQFSESTWNSLNTGYARADLAPPAVQDQAIIRNTNRSSSGIAGQNPGCYYSTGISAFPPGQ